MLSLKDVKMKPKLIGLFLALGIIPLVLVGFWAANLATGALMEKGFCAEKQTIRLQGVWL